jgi:predicted  nucleic acid-binding Zn-ribbon protein
MTRPILLLARLNEADLTLDATRGRIAEIVEAARKPAELARAEEALAAAEKEVARLRQEQARIENEQAEAAAKIKQIETKLYDGKTTSSRELENNQRDLAQHRNQLAAVEDRLLEMMVAMENATATLTAAQAVVKRLTEEWMSRQAGLRAEYTKLKARLPGDQARAAAAREGLSPSLLRTYDHLRPRHGGRAVAELDGDTCSACRVQAPPSKLEPARFGEELVYCGNCGRLLWGE